MEYSKAKLKNNGHKASPFLTSFLIEETCQINDPDSSVGFI